jgi:hypothetical protein
MLHEPSRSGSTVIISQAIGQCLQNRVKPFGDVAT